MKEKSVRICNLAIGLKQVFNVLLSDENLGTRSCPIHHGSPSDQLNKLVAKLESAKDLYYKVILCG